MTPDREDAIIRKAIDTFGADAQIIVAIEECSELIKALTKWKRIPPIYTEEFTAEYIQKAYANVWEEMADVEIMLQQLKLLFGDCTEMKVHKLERLEKRLNNI